MAGESGPWQTRVSFAPDGSFAYRPGQVLVRRNRNDVENAQAILFELAKQKGLVVEKPPPLRAEKDATTRSTVDAADQFPEWEAPGAFTLFKGVPDTLEAVAKLNQAGIYAQVNHVLFAHTSPGPGGDGLQANPFYANPFYANPFYANPFYANPFYANPFYANPFYANPNPAADPSFRETGRRPSSARPAARPPKLTKRGNGSERIRIAVLDTGYADKRFFEDRGVPVLWTNSPPQMLDEKSARVDVPDQDAKGYLDPVAGHGTFIAGLIERLAPGCSIEVLKVLETYGDSDEVAVSKTLHQLAQRDRDGRPHLVNLSFGGYSSTGMGVLAEAIARLHRDGVTIVASAGNDATSRPMYPAVLPYVIAVGALDHEGVPAPFTNYGPWVRACALGVELVSTFFAGFRGDHPTARRGGDADDFAGWAVWSGTSFAAPLVVAALADQMNRWLQEPDDDDTPLPHRAVAELIDRVGDQIPLLGTVIDPFKLLNPEEEAEQG